MAQAGRILVVDDDPDVVEQLTLLLRGWGYEVASAGGQEEAEEVLMTFRPDLAIVDLIMEEQDSGFILCHEIRRIYPGTPVILLTSVRATTGLSFAPRTPEEQSWVKADRVLDKPVRPEQIRAEVERLLAEAAARPAGAGGD